MLQVVVFLAGFWHSSVAAMLAFQKLPASELSEDALVFVKGDRRTLGIRDELCELTAVDNNSFRFNYRKISYTLELK